MYIIIWEFHVIPEKEKEFVKLYGRNGQWVKFFETDDDYFESDLIKDVHKEGRYVTVDYWIDKKAYEHFRTQHNEEYQELDLKGASFTLKEKQIGEFESL